MNPVIRLHNATGAGLIICCQTGVMVSNQTGGTSCLQSEIEGMYVPIENEDLSKCKGYGSNSIDLQLGEIFCGPKYRGSGATRGLDEIDADHIDAVLENHQLKPTLSVDRNRLRDSHEAWVHVVIQGDSNLETYTDFFPYPRPGVLTWCNSD